MAEADAPPTQNVSPAQLSPNEERKQMPPTLASLTQKPFTPTKAPPPQCENPYNTDDLTDILAQFSFAGQPNAEAKAFQEHESPRQTARSLMPDKSAV